MAARGDTLLSRMVAVADAPAEPHAIGGTLIMPFTLTLPRTEQPTGPMAMVFIDVPKLPVRPVPASLQPLGKVQ